MGYAPDDDNYDEWMNASAEEWSKPEKPSSNSDQPAGQTNRWGSPISTKAEQDDPRRWGSDQPAPVPGTAKTKQRRKFPWWIILIIVLVVLCLCTCVVVGGLELFGVINIFQ